MTPLERKTHLVLLGQSLLDEWDARYRLRVEGDKLWGEANKLWRASDNLRREGSKLFAEGNKLYDESSKLYDEGNGLWADAVTAASLTMEWVDADTCELSNGEIYYATRHEPRS